MEQNIATHKHENKHLHKIKEGDVDNINKQYVDRFVDDDIDLSEEQNLIINKLCNTNYLHDLFLVKFYNEDDSLGTMITKFRLFKLDNGIGQDIDVIDIEEEIFRNNWLKLTNILEDLFQEHLSFWKVKKMLKNLNIGKYDINYIIKKHKNNLYENFVCIVQ